MNFTDESFQEAAKKAFGEAANNRYNRIIEEDMLPKWYSNIPEDIFNAALAHEKLFDLKAKDYIANNYPEYLV